MNQHIGRREGVADSKEGGKKNNNTGKNWSSRGLSDPAHVEHLRCSSCLPDHGMKEACVGQWSRGTLVPVCVSVCDCVCVSWSCLLRRPEKCVKGGRGRLEEIKEEKGEMMRWSGKGLFFTALSIQTVCI